MAVQSGPGGGPVRAWWRSSQGLVAVQSGLDGGPVRAGQGSLRVLKDIEVQTEDTVQWFDFVVSLHFKLIQCIKLEKFLT